MNKGKRSGDFTMSGNFRFGYILILIFCFLLVFLSYYGIKSIPEHDFQNRTLLDIFTQPILANKGYTFLGTLTDFDRQLADFYYNNIFSLIFAGIFLKYDITKKSLTNKENALSINQNKDKDIDIEKNKNILLEKSKKIVIILGIIAVFYIVLVYIFSVFNVGWSFIANNGRNIILFDFYDYYFSTKLVPFLLLFLGGAKAWYLLFRRHFKSKYVSNPVGGYLIIIAFILFNLRLMTQPIDSSHIINNMTLISILTQFLQILLVIGTILIIQSKIAAFSEDIISNWQNKKINTQFWLSFLISFALFAIIVAIFIIEEPWVSLNIGYIFLAVPNLIISVILTCLYYHAGILVEVKYLDKISDPKQTLEEYKKKDRDKAHAIDGDKDEGGNNDE